jgi:membrane protease YdiL (CAAX protease family)
MSNYPDDGRGAPGADRFAFPYGSVLGSVAAMFAVFVIFLFAPLWPVAVYQLVVKAAGWQHFVHAHRPLVAAVLEEVCYVFSFSLMIALFLRVARNCGWRGSLPKLVGATRDKLQGQLPALLGIGVLGWIVANILIELAYGLLPLPSPDSPAGDFGMTLHGAAFMVFSLGTVVFAPLFEEVVFRGFLFNMLRVGFRKTIIGRLSLTVADWAAIIVSSAFFAGMHMTATGFPGLFITGMVLAWVYRRTNNLYASMAVHFVNNSIATFMAMHH